MDKQRYGIVDKTGKNIIVKKDNARYIGIDELVQHIAMDIIEDYQDIIKGDKKIDETNIKLSIKVLNAITPVVETFNSVSRY
jgi:hypothetical protein